MEEKIKICKLTYKLISSICEENSENELHAFNLIYQFQHHVYLLMLYNLDQAKYFQEAVDCFVSIIGKNETILSKLSEEIEMQNFKKDIETKSSTKAKKNQIQIFNSLKLNFRDKSSKDLKPQNFIIYFLKLIKENPQANKNRNYIKFLRSLCTCNSKGMSVNQELLFKVFSTLPDLNESAFFTINM